MKYISKLFLITGFIYYLLPSSSLAEEIHTGKIIVHFKEDSSSKQRFSNFKAYSKSHNLTTLHKNTHIKQASSQEDWEEFIDNPSVEYVEWDYLYSLSEAEASLKTFTSHTLSPSTIENYYELSGKLLKTRKEDEVVLTTRDVAESKKTPIIAVIDTGIDLEHKVFRQSQAVWENPEEIPGNNIDDDGNGFVDDLYGWNFISHSNNIQDTRGHGTYVSGIVLGSFVNIFSEELERSPVKIMPLKVFRDNGKAPSSAIAKAIYYAVDQGAQFLNLSLGSSSYSHTLHKALAYAYKKGVFIVTASGNESLDLEEKSAYPASLPVPSLMSVASINGRSNNLSSFSNYGKSTVLLAAPGESILTSSPGDLFVPVSGTSMSAPFVTAFAAYISMRYPSFLTIKFIWL